MDDRELLREYVARHSEAAFAELVARHLPGVLATAQRLLREPHAAADVAQTVFIQLARKAWTIREGQGLSGWLYRATRNAAFNALRDEQRRQQRETNAMQDADIQTSSEPGWADLAPWVDEAMRQLKRPEQDVVLLRFFEGKSYGEIGRLLNLDEKTAGQRAHRALEKMRLYFSRQGVTTTTVLLGSVLGAHGATALPAEMTAQVAGASLAGTGGSTSSVLLFKTLYMTTTTKLILGAAVFVTAATVFTVSQQREISQLRAELSAKSATTVTKKPVALSAADLLARAKADIAQALEITSKLGRARKMLDCVGTLDAGTVKALLDDLASKPLTPDNNAVLSYLISRWTELDPQAAFTWTQSLHDPHMKASLLEQVFDAWSGKNPAAALNALVQMKGALIGGSYLSVEVIQTYARQDPQGALAAILNLPLGQQVGLTSVLFQTWADQDPSAAAAAALNLPPSVNRRMVQYSIAGEWALEDPSAAMAYAKTLPAGPIQNTALTSVLLTLGKQDPASAADYAINLNLPAGPSRDNLIQQITSNWAQADPNALFTWADKNLTGADFDTAAKAALGQMSKSDPAAAAAAIAQLSDPNVVNQAIPQLANYWGTQDVQAALAWAQSLPSDNTTLRNTAISNVLGGWTFTDPAAAAAYIQQNFASDPAFGKLVTQAVNDWGNADPQAALKYAEGLPQGAAQDAAVVAAMTQLANVDPQTAWNDAQQLSGSNGGKAEVSIINAWASQQPTQAAQALTSLPPGSNLDTATADVAKSWLTQDPAAAAQWINTLPQGSTRDGAVIQLITTVGKNDPASAFNWAESLGNETTRNTQVVKLATQWSSSNPSAAAAAAQNAMSNLTGLTPAQQTALQKVVDKASAK